MHRRIPRTDRQLVHRFHRHGDMRRLIWQYGRNAESIFPKGPYEPDNTSKAGANYGTDVNLPIPEEESNNPLFLKGPAGCINRSAGISLLLVTLRWEAERICCFPASLLRPAANEERTSSLGRLRWRRSIPLPSRAPDS